MSHRFPALLLCLLLLTGCTARGGDAAAPTPAAPSLPPSPTVETVELQETFQDASGCAVLYDAAADRYRVYREELCRTQASPWSTFKIVAALTGLQTGVLADTDAVRPWSGT